MASFLQFQPLEDEKENATISSNNNDNSKAESEKKVQSLTPSDITNCVVKNKMEENQESLTNDHKTKETLAEEENMDFDDESKNVENETEEDSESVINDGEENKVASTDEGKMDVHEESNANGDDKPDEIQDEAVRTADEEDEEADNKTENTDNYDTDSKSDATILDEETQSEQMDEVNMLEEEPEHKDSNEEHVRHPITGARPKRIIKVKEDDQFVTGNIKIKEEKDSGDEAHLEFEIEESPRGRGGHTPSRGRGRGRKGGRRVPNVGIAELSPTLAEKWQKPFPLGWSRELVIRNQGSDDIDFRQKNKRQMADAYYYTPEKKKLRSMVQISDYLTRTGSPLTTDNFTFSKQPIYKEPEETIRLAGRHQRTSSGFSPRGVSPRGRGKVGRPAKPKPPMVTMVQSTTGSSPAPEKTEVVIKKRHPGRPPKHVPAENEDNPDLGEGSLFPEPSRGFQIEIVNDDDDDDDQEDSGEKEKTAKTNSVQNENKKRPATSLPAREKPGPKRFKKFYQEEPVVEKPTSSPEAEDVNEPSAKMCGMDCAGQEGIPPSLCCDICMSMFHPACVSANKDQHKQFRCKNCSKYNVKKTSEQTAPASKPPFPVSITPNRSIKLTSSTSSETTIKISSVISQANTSSDPQILRPASNNKLLIGSQYNPAQQMAAPTPVSVLRAAVPTQIVNPNQIQQMVVSRPPPPMISQFQTSAPGSTVVSQPKMRFQLPMQQRSLIQSNYQGQMQPPPPPPPTLQNSNHGNQQLPKNMSGQLLTLPPNVLRRLNLVQPLAIKLNNKTLVVSPTCFIPTADGMKVFLPPETLPSDSLKATDISISQGPNSLVNSAKTVNTSPVKLHLSNNKSPESVGSLASVVPPTTSPTTKTANITVTETTTPTTPTPEQSTVTRTRAGPRSKTRVANSKQVCHFQPLLRAYDCMFTIFEYLNVADRLRASRVCKSWRRLAANNFFWRNVYLKNVCVTDWDAAVRTMNRFGTDKLDMCGLLHSDDRNRTWHQFTAALPKFKTLNELILGQCPASILYVIADKQPNLSVLAAEWITDSTSEPAMWNTKAKIDMAKLARMKGLQELRLRGVCGLYMPSVSLTAVDDSSLSHLRQLSLTSLKNVAASEFCFLSSLENLQGLEIGEIKSWTSETYSMLGNLTNLRHLRLEYGGDINDTHLSDALLKLKKLLSLELIMIKISQHMESSLSQMKQLKSISVWPDISNEPAAVNSNTLNALANMTNLKTLDWGISVDEQTSIILNDDDDDQTNKVGDTSNKKLECIPFRTSRAEPMEDDTEASQVEAPQTEYISISSLVDKLHQFLKDTKIRVFRVPSLTANVISKAV